MATTSPADFPFLHRPLQRRTPILLSSYMVVGITLEPSERRSSILVTQVGGRTLFDSFPSFRWVFPQAPVRRVASTGETWPQWFDVWNVRDFADNEELQSIGLKGVIPVLRKILAGEAAALGGRWDRVVLAGISMGAATSVHTLFNLNIPEAGGGRLAAFLGFSCRCPFTGRSLLEMRKVLGLDDVPNHANVLHNTPMLLEHCVDDPLVLLRNGQDLRDTLRGFGANVEWNEYPDGGHWFNSPRGMDDVIDFLNTHVISQDTDINMDLS